MYRRREVKGEVNGKPYNGIVYSATNDKGEKQGNPFKSSSLGKSVGYEAIQRHIKKSAKGHSGQEPERADPPDGRRSDEIRP